MFEYNLNIFNHQYNIIINNLKNMESILFIGFVYSFGSNR